MPLALPLLLALPAGAEVYADTFDADSGAWTGGTVAGGVLSVTDGEAVLDLGPLATLEGTVRVRLVEGDRLRVGVGGAVLEADYREAGGLSLGGDPWPLPHEHLRWVPDPDPVLQPDGAWWDGGNTLHAEVWREATDGIWFLWWTGEMREGYGYRQIGVATSADGITWTEWDGNPVLTIDYDLGAIDGVHVHMPTVTQDDGGTWHLFYACYQNDVGNRICHATSPDGLAWTPEGMALDLGAPGEFDSGSLRMPDVWRSEDGAWHLLYNGTVPDQHYGPTGYATSPDGWTWTKHGAISADEDLLQGGSVVASPYRLEQWYNVDDRFEHAWADPADPTVWTATGTVLTKGWADWTTQYIQAPTAWLDGPTYHFWFNAFGPGTDGSWHERIGHARTVPVPGPWMDLDLAWDGAVLSVTLEGAALETPLDAASGIAIRASGTAEVDRVSLAFTRSAGPDTGDTETSDTDHQDSVPLDSNGDTSASGSGDGDGGCGCGAGPRGQGWSSTILAGLLFWIRRRSPEGVLQQGHPLGGGRPNARTSPGP